jgi:hypothetical protein
MITLSHAKRVLISCLLYSATIVGYSSITMAMPYHVLSEDASLADTMPPSEHTDSVIVSIDYCYAGTVTDPNTGETVDLYVFCQGDGIEQNLDLA